MKREKVSHAIYRFPSWSKSTKHLLASYWMMVVTHASWWTHLWAAPLWVLHALNCCLVLRAIAPVSGSQVSLVSGTAFSKHRQTIYQNAQNFILIIV